MKAKIMPMTGWNLLYRAIFQPAALFEPIQSGRKSKVTRFTLFVICLLFATFVAAYVYNDEVWHISRDDPLKIYEFYIDIASLLVIGFVAFWIWVIIDGLFLKAVFAKHRDIHTGLILTASQSIWLLLIPMFVILRFIYNQQYLANGLWWIPIITVGITLIWHYGLLGYLSLKTASQKARMVKTTVLFLVLLVLITSLLLFLILEVPVLLRSTAQEAFLDLF
jgi:hypothetical protein